MKTIVKKYWDVWKEIVAPISRFQSRLLFLLLYLCIFCPLGLLVSVFSDPLKVRQKHPAWQTRKEDYDAFESATRQ